MKIIDIDFENFSKEDIKYIADYFKKGKIVIYPTDTVYGIGCDATNENAIKKVLKIKNRDSDKPFLVLVKSWCMLKDNFFVSKKQNDYLRNIWFLPKDKKKTKAVSVVLRKREGCLDFVSSDNSAAVRLPNNNFLIQLIKEVGSPIVSTSANKSGEDVIENINNIEKIFKKIKPDLVINIKKKLKSKSSRLIDITSIEEVKILRK